MLSLRKGRYLVRPAESGGDLRRALALRSLCFQRADTQPEGDSFDAHCRHVLIEDSTDDALIGCFRMLQLPDGKSLGASYSAQYYDLAGLLHFPAPMLEIGRFCIHPRMHDPDILRLAWAALTRWVDATGIGMLFGCTSFPGAAEENHKAAFDLLRHEHLSRGAWSVARKAGEVFDFHALEQGRFDRQQAQAALPPLLRTYLLMGGWVSDHAVYDRQLDTMHVFTAVEVGAIPPARARLLRALAD